MKILHTADWHLGRSFYGHSREAEHRHFLDWLVKTAEERQPDVLIVAGDIYDSPAPSAGAEHLLYDFLDRLTQAVKGIQVILAGGCHDGGARLEAAESWLTPRGVYARGVLKHTPQGDIDASHFTLPLAPLGGGEAECVVLASPCLCATDYAAGLTAEQGWASFFETLQAKLRKSPWRGLPTVAVAHFMARGGRTTPEDRAERLEAGAPAGIDAGVVGREVSYTALGGLHRPQQVGGAPGAYYAGSPLAESFDAREVSRSVNWVVLSPDGAISVSRIGYEPLCALRSLPDNPEAPALDAAQLAKAIDGLPRRSRHDDEQALPYLEIRLHEDLYEQGIPGDLLKRLSERAVRFCRMVRKAPATTDKPQKVDTDPVALAAALWEQANQSPLSTADIERLRRAMKAD